jgi:hypothetical protein
MDKKLTLNDTINVGKNKKVLVSDLVGIKGEIFKYIKKGIWFDDEVLEKAGIKRIIREEKVETVFSDKKTKSENIKIYPKETESLKNVLKSINTLDNIDNDDSILFKEENDDIYTNELVDLEDD